MSALTQFFSVNTLKAWVTRFTVGIVSTFAVLDRIVQFDDIWNTLRIGTVTFTQQFVLTSIAIVGSIMVAGQFYMHFRPWVIVADDEEKSLIVINRLPGEIVGIFLAAASVFYIATAEAAKLPEPMTGDFNIAVTQFTVTGKGATKDTAYEFAQLFSNAVERRIETFNDDIDFDQTLQILPPHQIRSIWDADPTVRTEQAAKLAGELNANFVLLGAIKVDDLGAEFDLEFYIYQDSSFGEATGIVDPYPIDDTMFIDQLNSTKHK